MTAGAGIPALKKAAGLVIILLCFFSSHAYANHDTFTVKQCDDSGSSCTPFSEEQANRVSKVIYKNLSNKTLNKLDPNADRPYQYTLSSDGKTLTITLQKK
jgi:hypothetical protein